jgi:DNA polymerase-3 subunit epsilon
MTPRDTARAWLADPLGVVVDTETTGLQGYAVEMAVIDMHGQVKFNGRFNPQVPVEPGAFAVHGIVVDPAWPTFEDRMHEVWAAVEGRNVIAYNAKFDRSVLERECGRLLNVREWRCAMLLVADGGRWPKLVDGDHSALGDARACLEVVRRVAAGGVANAP